MTGVYGGWSAGEECEDFDVDEEWEPEAAVEHEGCKILRKDDLPGADRGSHECL